MLMRALVLVAAVMFAGVSFAQGRPVYSDRDGAIGGYDPVAFFTFACSPGRRELAQGPEVGGTRASMK
jgi:hypothetical protein